MPDLCAAIVHYHLRPGGVTTVIEHAVASLAKEDIKTVVLTGEPPGPESPLRPDQVCVLPCLTYSDTPAAHCPGTIAGKLQNHARAKLDRPPDLWHFHNHALGKNPDVTQAVHHLAKTGQRMLLQIHDFAEDGRPADYHKLLTQIGEGNSKQLGARLYPQADHVHYALLNTRDDAFLAEAALAGITDTYGVRILMYVAPHDVSSRPQQLHARHAATSK